MSKSSKTLFLIQWFLVYALSDLAGHGLTGLLPV